MKKQILSFILIVFAANTIIAQKNNIPVQEDTDDYMIPLSFEEKAVEKPKAEEETSTLNFAEVETPPVFPGCEDNPTNKAKYNCFMQSIVQHIKTHFAYPAIAKDMGIQGRVIIQFIIGKNGSVIDSKILRGVDKNLDNEALRIISLLPRMEPATQRGINVPVSFMIPITFKLSKSDKETKK